MPSFSQEIAQTPFPQGQEKGQAPAQASAPRLPYRLYEASAVTIATFFGTPLAGATLLFLNDRRLGRPGRARITLVAAIAVTGLAVRAGWNLPKSVASVLAVVLTLLIGQTARILQGAAIQDHLQRGGRLASKWAAFALGLGFLAVIFAGGFAAVSVPAYLISHGPRVVVGSKDEVYYSGSATQKEAQALGNILKADGYFTDKGATVRLDKGANGAVVSFVVKEWLWDQPAAVAIFEEMGREAAPSLGGFPLKVRLVDEAREVRRESTVGSAVFAGNDHVYYLGDVTATEAAALGGALESAGFLTGSGVDVFLSRHGDDTTLSFVVGDGVWVHPDRVANLEKIARRAAPAVGGLPLQLRLESTALDVKKDETLN